jgi:hypothetical protein
MFNDATTKGDAFAHAPTYCSVQGLLREMLLWPGIGREASNASCKLGHERHQLQHNQSAALSLQLQAFLLLHCLSATLG